jgi:hypothetical protein
LLRYVIKNERRKTVQQKALLLTFADGDQVFTRFNGTREDAVSHYGQNNLLTADYGAQVVTIEFSPDDIHTFTISEDKRRDPNALDESWFV